MMLDPRRPTLSVRAARTGPVIVCIIPRGITIAPRCTALSLTAVHSERLCERPRRRRGEIRKCLRPILVARRGGRVAARTHTALGEASQRSHVKDFCRKALRRRENGSACAAVPVCQTL